MTNEAKITLTADDQMSAVFRAARAEGDRLAASFETVKAAAAGLGAIFITGKIAESISNVVENLKNIHEAAQNLGIAASQLSSFQLSAKAAGVDSDQFGVAITKLNVRLVDAAAGGKDSAAIFGALGIKLRDAQGNVRDTGEVLGDVAQKFSGYADGAEKTALAVELFGKSGARFIAFLNQGREGLTKFGGASEEAIRSAAKFNDELNRFSAESEKAKIALAEKILPFLTQTVEQFNAARDAAGGFFGALTLLAQQSQNTLDDPGKKIVQLRRQIEDLNKENQTLANFASQGPRIEVNKERIASIQTELKFLKQLQAARALDNYNPETDFGREGRRGGASGALPKAPTINKQDLSAFDAYIKSLNDQINKLDELSEYEKVLQAIDEGRFGKLNAAQEKTLINYAEEVDFLKDIEESEKQATKDAEARIKSLKKQEEFLVEFYKSLHERLKTTQSEILSGAAKGSDPAKAAAAERELERKKYSDQLYVLVQSREEELITEQDYRAKREQLEQNHQQNLTRITDEETQKRYNISRVYHKLDLDSAGYALGQLAGLMNSKSRSMFEVGKAAAIAETVINTYRSATGAYAALASIPVVGPALGIAAAAAAVAGGIANVQRIRATPFGGGSAPSGGGQPVVAGAGPFATSSSSAPIAVAPTAAAPKQVSNITIVGKSFGAEQVRELITQIQEQINNGADLRLSMA